MTPDAAIITTKSIVSNRTRRGIVQIDWGTMGGQFDPEDARAFAHTILRECDNAETDAFLFDYFRVLLGDEQKAVMIVGEFRIHRARLEQRAGLRRLETGSELPPEERR